MANNNPCTRPVRNMMDLCNGTMTYTHTAETLGFCFAVITEDHYACTDCNHTTTVKVSVR
ncbi:hypothetical protein K0U83_12690 [bacterium]|nr:hypothetical protein [bacterium]